MTCNTEKRPCSLTELLGTWIPFKSEIPKFELGDEIYHFTADRKFLWEFPTLQQSDKIWKSAYRLEGFELTYFTATAEWNITAWFEDDVLILLPKHGYRTYSKRIDSVSA